MSNAANILTFGSFDANDGTNTFLVGDLVLGAPSREVEFLGGPGADIARVGAVDTSQPVESSFTVLIADTTVDNVATRLAALAAQLEALSPITVGLKGSAYIGTLRPLVARWVEVPLDSTAAGMLINKYRTQVEVSVLREPWVYGSTQTLYSSAAVSLPAVISLSSQKGSAPAPLDVLFDATSANIHQLVAGVYPDAGANINTFVRRAVELSWSGGSATTDANGWPNGSGNTVWRSNSSTAVTATVDVTNLLPGSYAVFANVKRDAAAAPATVATLPTISEPVAIEGTSLRRQLLGILSLPLTRVRGAATSSLTVLLTSDGTDYVYVNTIEFIPLSWGCWGWHHATSSSGCDKLRLEGGLTYADDFASLVYVKYGQELKSLAGALVVTAEATAAAPTLATTATISCAPRWPQLVAG